MYANTVK